MSIKVKTWQPSTGCKSCKDAERIMNDQMRHQGQYHGQVLKLRKQDLAKIEALQKENSELKKSINKLIIALKEMTDHQNFIVELNCTVSELLKALEQENDN